METDSTTCPTLEQLVIQRVRDNGDVRLVVGGEVDMATAGHLAEAIADAQENGSRRLVLDLTAVRFIDSSGLDALVHARRRADDLGQEMRLITSPQVARVIELVALGDYFA